LVKKTLQPQHQQTTDNMPRYAVVQIDAMDQPLQDAATLPPMPGGYSVLHVGQLVDGNVRHVAALLNLLLGFRVGDPHRVRYVLRAYVKKATTVAHQRTGYLVVQTRLAPAVLAHARTFWITPSGTAAVSRLPLGDGAVWPGGDLGALVRCPRHPVTVAADGQCVEQVLKDQLRLLPATGVMAVGGRHWTHNPYRAVRGAAATTELVL
jgi:hypothetical protein